MVMMPTLKNTSLGSPVAQAARMAPMRPTGTINSTATGVAQLSYKAARHRNTTRIDNPKSTGASAPASCSWNDCVAHA